MGINDHNNHKRNPLQLGQTDILYILQTMKKEHITADPKQSFRFFSWEGSLDTLQQHDENPAELTDSEGMGNVWHYHPEIELTLFTQGKGIRYIGDNVASFDAPDLVLLGANLPHYWDTDHSSGYCIQFLFDPTSPLAALHESGSLKSLLDKANKGLKFSNNCLEDILPLLEQCKQAKSLERLTLLLKVLDRLNNAKTSEISSYIPQGLSENNNIVIKKAVQYIVQNATDEELVIQHVLDHVNMSRATFSRHFQKVLGLSFTQFLQSIRLEKARNLLVSSDKSITEIAFEAGFSNLSHFNKIFKKRWSLSPRDLRKT